MVVAGLIIGNLGRKLAMNDMTRRYLDGFWELLDDMLNALLFALIGMELLLLPFNWLHVFAASLLAVAILLAPVDGGPGDLAAAALAHGTARHYPHPDLGWFAWRCLGGLGLGAALGSGARLVAEHHLHRGAVIDPVAGVEHRQAGQTRDPGRTPGHA